MLFNVYCDESCHLEHDGINVMALGAVWCPFDKVKQINTRITEIKEKHGVASSSEIKWSKVGPGKEQLYMDIIDFFFDDEDIHFRGLFVPDKNILNHERFRQTHDDWYHKMYFEMLKVVFSPQHTYNIYVDIKDTHSYVRFKKLKEVCGNNLYDFSASIIKKLQTIRSHEVQLMQLVDILTGALAYKNRIFPDYHVKSATKEKLICRVMQRSNYTLSKTTLYQEGKFNLLAWTPYARP